MFVIIIPTKESKTASEFRVITKIFPGFIFWCFCPGFIYYVFKELLINRQNKTNTI